MIKLLEDAMTWAQAMELPIRFHSSGSAMDSGRANLETLEIFLSPKFSSEEQLAIVLLHEMGHLAQTAYWRRRIGLDKEEPGDSPRLLEEELAWIAAELMVEHLGHTLPYDWVEERTRCLTSYYEHEGYRGLADGRASEGFDAAFFKRARRNILRNKAFRLWLSARPLYKDKEGKAA